MPNRKGLLPSKYYFIHYIDSEQMPDDEDFVSLNGLGYLYIGYADLDEKNFQELVQIENTFFSINEARTALKQIQKALAPNILKNQTQYSREL